METTSSHSKEIQRKEQRKFIYIGIKDRPDNFEYRLPLASQELKESLSRLTRCLYQLKMIAHLGY